MDHIGKNATATKQLNFTVVELMGHLPASKFARWTIHFTSYFTITFLPLWFCILVSKKYGILEKKCVKYIYIF